MTDEIRIQGKQKRQFVRGDRVVHQKVCTTCRAMGFDPRFTLELTWNGTGWSRAESPCQHVREMDARAFVELARPIETL